MQFILGVLIGIALCAFAYYGQKKYKENEFLVYNCPIENCGYHYECDDPLGLLRLVENHEQDHKRVNG